jgi:hypothetical protein
MVASNAARRAGRYRWPLTRRNCFAVSPIPAAIQRSTICPSCQRSGVGGVIAADVDHRLDGVGAAQGSSEGRWHAQLGHRQGLGQHLPQAGSSAGVGAVQLPCQQVRPTAAPYTGRGRRPCLRRRLELPVRWLLVEWPADEGRAGQVLAVQPARRDPDRGAGPAGQATLTNRARLPS